MSSIDLQVTCRDLMGMVASGWRKLHYNNVIMSAMASQIIRVWIVCSTVCLGADPAKYQSSASLNFVRGIHRWLVDSPHQGPVTRKCLLLMTSSWHRSDIPSMGWLIHLDLASWDGQPRFVMVPLVFAGLLWSCCLIKIFCWRPKYYLNDTTKIYKTCKSKTWMGFPEQILGWKYLAFGVFSMHSIDSPYGVVDAIIPNGHTVQ